MAVFCDVTFLDKIIAWAEAMKMCLFTDFITDQCQKDPGTAFNDFLIVPFERKFSESSHNSLLSLPLPSICGHFSIVVLLVEGPA